MAEAAVWARYPRTRRGARTRGVMAVTAAVGLVPVLSLLSGCTTIPDHGPVVQGRPVGADPRGPVFQVLAEGPRQGAGPEEMVGGFLRAAAGFTDEHRVARSFLVPQRAAAWLPSKSVQIYPGQASLKLTLASLDGKPVPAKQAAATPSPAPSTTPSASATASPEEAAAQAAVVYVRVPAQAQIDADGVYTATPARSQTIRFGLVRQGGQWRISTLPDGILLTSTDFDLTFRAFGVYFPDPTGSFLVPEVHWFPITNATPTLLAKAILSGPSPWLRPALTSGVPKGTRMTVPAVPVQAGVAVVDLNDSVLNADTEHRVMLLSQLRSTLVGVSGITDVKVTVGGAAFAMVASGGSARAHAQPDEPERRLQVDPQVDGRPLVLDGNGRLARIQGVGLAQRTLVGVAGTTPLAARGAVAPAAAPDGSAYAVLVQNRTRLLYQLPGTPRAETLLQGRDLTAPSFDPRGWVWSTGAACNGTVYAARPGRGAVPVRAPWLAGYRISDLKVSRDGTRALILATRNGIGRVLVTGIARNKQDTPTSLTRPLQLAPDLVVASSGAWVDDDEVVVLGRGRTGGVQPWVAQVGGPASATTASSSDLPADLTSVTAGNGELDLYVGTADGVVLTRAGAGWVPIATPAWWPTFPG
jgi:hypothetical protein